MTWHNHYPELNNLSGLVLEHGGSIFPLLIPNDLTGGTGICNPSVIVDDEEGILINIRHVNYSLYHCEFEQKHTGLWGCMQYLNPEDYVFLETKNFVCKLDNDLNILKMDKVNTHKFNAKPLWQFIGLEDARLVKWDDNLYLCGVRRDTTTNGEGRMELSHIEHSHIEGLREVSRQRIEPPEHTYLEKNWMPILDMPYHFIRWCNPVEVVKFDPQSPPVKVVVSKKITEKYGVECSGFRGGSQVISLGKYRMCIIHECFFPQRQMANKKDAHYYHRFVFFDEEWNMTKISKRFKFFDAMVEFCCGLAQHQQDLLITFGFQDNAAYLLKMPLSLLDNLEYEKI